MATPDTLQKRSPGRGSAGASGAGDRCWGNVTNLAREHNIATLTYRLIEVNVAEEPQKTGALPSDLPVIAQAVNQARYLRLRGVMTIAPMVPDPEQVRPVFSRLRTLRDETSQRLGTPLPVLSMGMTGDYPIAVEEGASMLRLGRALFGPR